MMWSAGGRDHRALGDVPMMVHAAGSVLPMDRRGPELPGPGLPLPVYVDQWSETPVEYLVPDHRVRSLPWDPSRDHPLPLSTSVTDHPVREVHGESVPGMSGESPEIGPPDSTVPSVCPKGWSVCVVEINPLHITPPRVSWGPLTPPS